MNIITSVFSGSIHKTLISQKLSDKQKEKFFVKGSQKAKRVYLKKIAPDKLKTDLKKLSTLEFFELTFLP